MQSRRYPPYRVVVMEFRLTYEGPLYGDKHPRPEHKHSIRRVFHRQLARLWDWHPLLRRRTTCTIKIPGWVVPGSDTSDKVLNERIQTPKSGTDGYDVRFDEVYRGTEWYRIFGLSLKDYLGDKFQMNGYRFVPLVREDLALVVSLHILFLRPGRPGSVVNSGDIDGRIKTLFDAFQIPKVGQLKADQKPEDGETPFFCLVEDDELITHVSVETDTLLEPTGKSPGHPESDVRLLITVKIHPYEHHPGNEGF
jgi:hypothetical protein